MTFHLTIRVINIVNINECNDMAHKELYEWLMNEQFIDTIHGRLKLKSVNQTECNTQPK